MKQKINNKKEDIFFILSSKWKFYAIEY